MIGIGKNQSADKGDDNSVPVQKQDMTIREKCSIQQNHEPGTITKQYCISVKEQNAIHKLLRCY